MEETMGMTDNQYKDLVSMDLAALRRIRKGLVAKGLTDEDLAELDELIQLKQEALER